jgi:hypothetical protein
MPVGLHGKHRAGFHCPAVQMNGTGPTGAGIAADVRACEAQMVAEEMDQQSSRLDFRLSLLTIDRNGDGYVHWSPFLEEYVPLFHE